MRKLLIIATALACTDGAGAAPAPGGNDSIGWVDRLALATAREYHAKGRFDDAENQLRALAKRTPLDAEGLTLAGDILRERGDWPRAEAAFRAAIQAEPGRADLHLRLGQALQEQQQLEAADREFAKYVELTRGSQP